MQNGNNLQKEIINFEKTICEKADVSFCVFDDSGNGITNKKNTVNIEKVQNYFTDKKNNRFVFAFHFLGEKYFGSLKGTGKELKPLANLICTLAENASLKKESLSFNDFFIRLLKGEIKGEEQNEYLLNNKISQNACECLIINIENGKNTEAKEFIENYIEEDDILIDLSNDLLALIKFESQTDIEYRSINEYAIFLLQSVYEETGATAKVYIGGKVNSVKDVNISFSQAENTKRISNKLCEGGNVHNYKEHVFYKILEDVGSYKLNEYLNTLLDYNESKIFEDEEMVNTAETFLENGLNSSETSRKMFLHRNTLTYRLDKIERETGLDVRNFSDAVTFRLITLIKKLLK